MTKTEGDIKKCIEPIIISLGYKLYDVIYEKFGKDNTLSIFIDKDGNIDINDCEKVNNAITDILDKKDFIKNSYMLEVSSPGLERRIRSKEHLSENIGKEIEIHTFKPVEGNKEFKAILKDFSDDNIIVEIGNKEICFNIKDISNMKTVYDWNNQ